MDNNITLFENKIIHAFYIEESFFSGKLKISVKFSDDSKAIIKPNNSFNIRCLIYFPDSEITIKIPHMIIPPNTTLNGISGQHLFDNSNSIPTSPLLKEHFSVLLNMRITSCFLEPVLNKPSLYKSISLTGVKDFSYDGNIYWWNQDEGYKIPNSNLKLIIKFTPNYNAMPLHFRSIVNELGLLISTV